MQDKTIRNIGIAVLAGCGLMLAGCAGLAFNEDWQENMKELTQSLRESYKEINWS